MRKNYIIVFLLALLVAVCSGYIHLVMQRESILQDCAAELRAQLGII